MPLCPLLPSLEQESLTDIADLGIGISDKRSIRWSWIRASGRPPGPAKISISSLYFLFFFSLFSWGRGKMNLTKQRGRKQWERGKTLGVSQGMICSD
jgi:hypothetical protein